MTVVPSKLFKCALLSILTTLLVNFFCHVMQSLFNLYHDLSVQVYNKLDRSIPGFRTVLERVQAEAIDREAKRKEKREAEKRAEKEMKMFGRVESDR